MKDISEQITFWSEFEKKSHTQFGWQLSGIKAGTAVISIKSIEMDLDLEKKEILIFSNIVKKLSAQIFFDDESDFKIDIIYFIDHFSIPISEEYATKKISEIRLFCHEDLHISKIYIGHDNSEYFYALKINLHSGIGDSLKAISRNSSLRAFAASGKLKLYWTYAADGLRDSNWRELFKTQLFNRVGWMEYVSNDAFHFLNVSEISNGYSGAIFNKYDSQSKMGIDIPLTGEEESFLHKLHENVNFGIGVQLQGNDPKKRWSSEKYIELFRLLLIRFPLSKIFILDAPSVAVDPAMLFDQRIISLVGVTNIAQNINLIQSMDLWISPDSFSKYVANWSNTQQVSMCCSYPHTPPHLLMEHAYNNVGLCFNPRVNIIGIEFDQYLNIKNFVDDVNDITPEQVMKAIEQLLI